MAPSWATLAIAEQNLATEKLHNLATSVPKKKREGIDGGCTPFLKRDMNMVHTTPLGILTIRFSLGVEKKTAICT